MLKPVTIDFSSVSEIRVSYAGIRIRQGGVCDIVASSFSGRYREGVEGEADARFIKASGQAAAMACLAEGMILDLSSLEFAGGEDLTSILDIGHEILGCESLHLAVLAGPKSEAGLASLRTIQGMIFRDFELALCYVEAEMVGIATRLFPSKRPPLLSMVTRNTHDAHPRRNTTGSHRARSLWQA